MNHMKYKCIWKSHQSFINDKVQLSHVECTLEKIKQLVLMKHHIQSNRTWYKWTSMTTMINKSKVVPIVPCFNCERLCFVK